MARWLIGMRAGFQLFQPLISDAVISGQPKQAETEIGRNRNKCLRKAEALAKTEASAETFLSAEIHCFSRMTVSANQFILGPSLLWTQTD